jgi:RNA-directed DNA polymerase
MAQCHKVCAGRPAGSRRCTSLALERVRQAAGLRKKETFTSLYHHLSLDLLHEAFVTLKRDAVPGADGVTWRSYAADLERNLIDLHARLHRGAYRAQPSRRTWVPKSDGKQRPLAVAALEDKIVQKATVAALNCIDEEEFVGFSAACPGQVARLREPGDFVPSVASMMRWTPLRTRSPPRR